MTITGFQLTRLREKTPLVHHITNWVVTNFTANVTLALGASPVMAHALEESEEMAQLADALVLNIGTLTLPVVEAMVRAGKKANERGVPVILDPVGVGATSLRTRSTSRILEEVKVSVLRGNLSEIASIAGEDAKTRGVDSVASGIDPARLALVLTQRLGCTVAITGAEDHVTDGHTLYKVGNGHPLLSQVTGTGCSATSIIAAFAAVEADMAKAAATGLAFFGLAAERAAEGSTGPGTFASRLLDEIHCITPSDLERGARVESERVGGVQCEC